jgi:hypothetical protein
MGRRGFATAPPDEQIHPPYRPTYSICHAVVRKVIATRQNPTEEVCVSGVVFVERGPGAIGPKLLELPGKTAASGVIQTPVVLRAVKLTPR